MQDEEEPTEEESTMSVPAEDPPPEEVEEKPKDEMADLFEVPQPEDNDMTTAHLVAAPKKDDLSDLTDPPEEEDISDLFAGGEPLALEPEPEPVKRPERRVKFVKRYPPPPTSLRGVGS